MGLVSGLGDYKVKKNVLLGNNMPIIDNKSGAGGITVRFQEYLGDVVTPVQVGNSSPFDIKTFLINPANSQTFPWLSQLAANFEQYEIEGMLFGFRTTAADMVTNTTNNLQLGTVIMATQYDVADALFGSKAEMLNYEFSSSVKPSEGAVHMIECDPRQTAVNILYTSPGAVPTGTDPRLYHLGRFAIATQGFQGSGVTIGELHITYQVRLLKPKLWSGLGETIPMWRALTDPFVQGAGFTPLGDVRTVQTYAQSTLNMSLTPDADGEIAILTFPTNARPVRYLVMFTWIASAGTGAYWAASANTPNSWTLTGGATKIVQQVSPFSGTNLSAHAQYFGVIQVPGNSSCGMICGDGTTTGLPPGLTMNCRIYVTVVDPQFA